MQPLANATATRRTNWTVTARRVSVGMVEQEWACASGTVCETSELGCSLLTLTLKYLGIYISYKESDVFLDIDECKRGTDNCQELCFNAEGGFSCGCIDPKARLSNDLRTCIGMYCNIIQKRTSAQNVGWEPLGNMHDKLLDHEYWRFSFPELWESTTQNPYPVHFRSQHILSSHRTVTQTSVGIAELLVMQSTVVIFLSGSY